MEIGKSRRRPEWDLHSGNPPQLITKSKQSKESNTIAGHDSGIWLVKHGTIQHGGDFQHLIQEIATIDKESSAIAGRDTGI